MITEEQAIEIKRLANMLAVARVRRFAVATRPTCSNETEEGVAKKVLKAAIDFDEYLKGLMRL